MAPKQAVATSLIVVVMLSIPAMIAHASLGHINWSYALLLAIGVIPGARLGSRLTIHGSEERLRLIMGLLFLTIGLVYGVSEIRSL